MEYQIESLNEEDKKEWTKFLLINSYKENKIKAIIKKQENLELEEKNEINKEFLDYDFSKAVNDNERESNEQQENEGGNNDFNFNGEGKRNQDENYFFEDSKSLYIFMLIIYLASMINLHLCIIGPSCAGYLTENRNKWDIQF